MDPWSHAVEGSFRWSSSRAVLSHEHLLAAFPDCLSISHHILKVLLSCSPINSTLVAIACKLEGPLLRLFHIGLGRSLFPSCTSSRMCKVQNVKHSWRPLQNILALHRHVCWHGPREVAKQPPNKGTTCSHSWLSWEWPTESHVLFVRRHCLRMKMVFRCPIRGWGWSHLTSRGRGGGGGEAERNRTTLATVLYDSGEPLARTQLASCGRWT